MKARGARCLIRKVFPITQIPPWLGQFRNGERLLVPMSSERAPATRMDTSQCSPLATLSLRHGVTLSHVSTVNHLEALEGIWRHCRDHGRRGISRDWSTELSETRKNPPGILRGSVHDHGLSRSSD